MAKSELSVIQKKALDLFAKSSLKDKFYWTGGTTLAHVYLHHRRSNDLDFFSDEPFSHDQIIGFVGDLKRTLSLPKIEEKKIFDRWEFFLRNKQKLRIEFVHYDHPRIRKRKRWRGILHEGFSWARAINFSRKQATKAGSFNAHRRIF